MCETVGYIPQAAAGKEVRCANPKCMVPVFVAPRIEKKAVEAPTPTKSGMPLILLGSLVVLLLGGAGGWYFFSQPARTTTTQGSGPAPPTPIQPPKGNQVGIVVPPAAPVQQVAEKQLTLAEEVKPVLDQMEKDAQNKERNLRPPYCQRVTAQTAADCGDLKRAKTYLDKLPQGTVELAFYRLGPLTAIALQQLAKSEKEEAGKTLDDALRRCGQPPFGWAVFGRIGRMARGRVGCRWPRQRGIRSRFTISRQWIHRPPGGSDEQGGGLEQLGLRRGRS